jgi:ABC-type transport system involved in multi-copper enzyme maturation permease subunit
VRAFRAELLKATTTRVLLWFGLGLLAFLVLALSIHIGSHDREGLRDLSTQRTTLGFGGLAAIVAVLIGSLVVTAEYAHGTINQSFLAVPVRGRLLAAKLAGAVVVVFVLAALADAFTLLIAELWYHGRGDSLHLDSYTLAPFLGSLGAAILAGGIGVGLGALVRRQTATIIAILLWLLIGESVISAVGDSARFAPGHVLGAVVAAHEHSTSGDMLAVWPAVVVGLVYVAIFCGVGFLAVAGSDVPSRGD